MPLAVLRGVEPVEQCGIVGQVGEQFAEGSESQLAQRLVLPLHKLEVIDLEIAGGKVVVPHQRETLLERVRGEEAAVEPPGFEALGAAGIGGGLADDGGEGIKILGDAIK